MIKCPVCKKEGEFEAMKIFGKCYSCEEEGRNGEIFALIDAKEATERLEQLTFFHSIHGQAIKKWRFLQRL